MSEHSPEPWEAGTLAPAFKATVLFNPITDGKGCRVGQIFCSEDDLRRIVACVNACKGIHTTTLEDVGKGFTLIATPKDSWLGEMTL